MQNFDIRKLLAMLQHPGRLVQRQKNGAAIPPGFEKDIHRARQLEAQSQRDPRAIVLLIQVYKQILERLQPDKNPVFYNAIQNNLGIAYRNLPDKDRVANLKQAVACYKEALRVWTPEAGDVAYAQTQNNLSNAYGDRPDEDRPANLQ